ncbi:hypothetical protein HYR99_27345 [Candidatus Poribacteria bacterium]|nr:hypothetical protein [Candidatus Poribacteria bacterium]
MPLVLYSVNTYLAYTINERYYGSKHYVWCSEVFDARANHRLGRYSNIPPTSNPHEIYLNLYEEVKRGDRHSAQIENNRKRILRGAEIKFQAGEISQHQRTEIEKIVNSVEISAFRPLLYIIPYHNVAAIVREATVEERAHPLSLEFIIESLDRHYFDPIEVLYV